MDLKPVIEMEDISFSYGVSPIFTGINACFHKGDYVAIVGPNGGGKSTFIKLITGLLTPSSGKLYVCGELQKLESRTNLSRIGYVPQYVNFDTLFPSTVLEAVLTGTLVKGWGFYKKRDRERAMEALELVDLVDFAHRPFSAISGGQRQRTLIARALASRPEILILDEPTANVDKSVEKHFRELLSRLNEDLTIILVTHDLGFVDAKVNRVFCINHNAIEHPLDVAVGDLINHSYGRTIKAVRHDHAVEPHHHGHAAGGKNE